MNECIHLFPVQRTLDYSEAIFADFRDTDDQTNHSNTLPFPIISALPSMIVLITTTTYLSLIYENRNILQPTRSFIIIQK
jgi:hypothetical protein